MYEIRLAFPISYPEKSIVDNIMNYWSGSTLATDQRPVAKTLKEHLAKLQIFHQSAWFTTIEKICLTLQNTLWPSIKFSLSAAIGKQIGASKRDWSSMDAERARDVSQRSFQHDKVYRWRLTSVVCDSMPRRLGAGEGDRSRTVYLPFQKVSLKY